MIVTAAIFEELIKQARWSELVQWSAEPALLHALSFRQVPRQALRRDRRAATADYLAWIIEKSELEEGIKHSANYWLRAAKGDADPTPE